MSGPKSHGTSIKSQEVSASHRARRTCANSATIVGTQHKTHFEQKLEYERATQMQSWRAQLDSGRARPLSRELGTLSKSKPRIWPRVQEQMFQILHRVADPLDSGTCYFKEMCSGSEAGSYSRLIVCVTQLQARK